MVQRKQRKVRSWSRKIRSNAARTRTIIIINQVKVYSNQQQCKDNPVNQDQDSIWTTYSASSVRAGDIWPHSAHQPGQCSITVEEVEEDHEEECKEAEDEEEEQEAVDSQSTPP